MVVELFVSAALLLGPPQGLLVEGPPEDDSPGEEGEGEEPDAFDMLDAPDSELQPRDEQPDEGVDEGETAASGLDVDAIVEAAAAAAKERAYLQRVGQEIDEYVKHLDALANVNAELDGCGGAIQAELRMALALAYFEEDETCEDESEVDQEREGPLPMPVLECFDSPDPRACADHLLELVAEFADQGSGGTSAPFSQAFGCPHAAAQMSVEQMFGQCLADQYDAAIDRYENAPKDDGEVTVWPIPRWASIAGVAGGAVLVITGGVLLGIDGKCPGGYDPVTQVADCPSVYNTNVGGGLLLGVGLVALVGMGVVLTVTEIQRSKQGDSRTSALRRKLQRAEARSGFRLTLVPPIRRGRSRVW